MILLGFIIVPHGKIFLSGHTGTHYTLCTGSGEVVVAEGQGEGRLREREVERMREMG